MTRREPNIRTRSTKAQLQREAEARRAAEAEAIRANGYSTVLRAVTPVLALHDPVDAAKQIHAEAWRLERAYSFAMPTSPAALIAADLRAIADGILAAVNHMV